MQRVTGDEIHKALTTWRVVHPDPYAQISWDSFKKFVGVDRFSGTTESRWIVSDESARKIKLMASPHGETMLKAMEAVK